MKTSVSISSVGNRNAYGLTDGLDPKIAALCIYKTLERNTCRSIAANYVVLNHTVSIICIFLKQNVSLLRELYYYARLHVSAILDAVMFQNV
jgi:hypothetical protein